MPKVTQGMIRSPLTSIRMRIDQNKGRAGG